MTGDREPVTGPSAPGDPRPLLERLGLGLIALILAGLFGAMAFLALQNGEVFLGVMAGIAVLMTLWAAATSVLRG